MVHGEVFGLALKSLRIRLKFTSNPVSSSLSNETDPPHQKLSSVLDFVSLFKALLIKAVLFDKLSAVFPSTNLNGGKQWNFLVSLLKLL